MADVSVEIKADSSSSAVSILGQMSALLHDYTAMSVSSSFLANDRPSCLHSVCNSVGMVCAARTNFATFHARTNFATFHAYALARLQRIANICCFQILPQSGSYPLSVLSTDQ